MWAVIVAAAVAGCSTECGGKDNGYAWSPQPFSFATRCQAPGLAEFVSDVPVTDTSCEELAQGLPVPDGATLVSSGTQFGGAFASVCSALKQGTVVVSRLCTCTPCAPASNTTKIMRPGYTALGIGLGLVTGGGAIAVGAMSG